MSTILLTDIQLKRHIELLETMAQMLTKEAEMLRNETKLTEAKVSKRKSKSEKEIEMEFHMRKYWRMRYRLMMKKLKTPEEQQLLREIAKKKNIII